MTLGEIRTLFAQQDLNPDTTNAQREANKHRLKMYELFTRPKAPAEPRPNLDVIMERLTTGTTYTPNSLLNS
jgi:hypothetical protein